MADLLFVPDRRVAYRLALLARPFCRLGRDSAVFRYRIYYRPNFLPRLLYDGSDCVGVHAFSRYGICPKWRRTRNW